MSPVAQPTPTPEEHKQAQRTNKRAPPPILHIDPEWPATPEHPGWVAICAAEWDEGNYFSLSGHIGAEWGQYVVRACNSFDALTEANKNLLQHVRDISSVVSFVGCEGSGDEICIDGEKAREDWCPMCRIGECVQDAIKSAK